MPKENCTSHQQSEMGYQQRINAVRDYISQNLGEPLLLASLAQIAGFSPFHFHRLFAAIVGETTTDYVRRLRMSQAAWQLTKTQMPVTQIALEAGYETPSAFTKAFKQYFGRTPSDVRACAMRGEVVHLKEKVPTVRNKARRVPMQATIREMPAQQVLYARAYGLQNGSLNNAAKRAFDSLFGCLAEHQLTDKFTFCLGICPDDPASVPPEMCRYEAGVILQPGVEVELNGENRVQFQTLPAGRYAIFIHKGPYENLWQTWNAIYRDWVPTSGETLRDAPPYELYVCDMTKTAPEDLVTEIYIPIV